MRAMYLAERRNEKRLYQKYLAEEIDESYSYPDDDQNETGEALFLMWRARVGRNGQVNAVCVQNEKFRDEHGNPVKSVSLRLSLHDFLCKGIVNSQAGRFEAPLLDIASDELNDSLRETLRYYRQERNMVQKRKAEEEIERRLQEAAQKKSKKEQEPRTPPDVPDQRPGILGRIRKHGRLVSARFG
ncbi:hypothetical protein SAMD00023353_1101620 [Rosellinia necatrix]|uniref:Uncharacterized protein n=1 Tax=Rosellinia necatrix TaxID=77044 RepID=A0A1S8A715_ROSNE|nr:hypothetical protein SAMD00023353_1101620 [Rosellinia necatrix]